MQRNETEGYCDYDNERGNNFYERHNSLISHNNVIWA